MKLSCSSKKKLLDFKLSFNPLSIILSLEYEVSNEFQVKLTETKMHNDKITPMLQFDVN